MSVEVFYDLSAWAAFERGGEDGVQPGPPLFASPAWFDCLHRHGMPGSVRPRVYRAAAPEGSCSLVLCHHDAERRLASLTTYYSVMFAPTDVAGGPPDRAALDAVIAHLAKERPRWRRVRLWYICNPEIADTLVAAFRAQGYTARRTAHGTTWSVDVAGHTYASYLSGRPSRLRNTISRKARKAARAGVVFRLYTAPEPAGMDAYQAVYRTSWKRDEPYPEFIPTLARTAAAQGALRLGVLWQGDQPLAAQIWLINGATAVIYKLAQVPDGDPLSAGTLLTANMMETVGFEPGIARVSFGYGDEPYKALWMDRRDAVHVVEAAPTFSAPAQRIRLGGLKDHAAAYLRRDAAGSA